MTVFLTAAVLTALCFAIASTRKYGVVCTGTLLYFQPILTIGVLLLAGIAYYFYRKKYA